jgi:hypothetical protein
MIRLTVVMSFLAFPAFSQTLYQSLGDAQGHCRNDTVVWLNTRTDVYHFEGERWYGNTKEGSYVCKQQADAAGDRPTKNGQ